MQNGPHLELELVRQVQTRTGRRIRDLAGVAAGDQLQHIIERKGVRAKDEDGTAPHEVGPQKPWTGDRRLCRRPERVPAGGENRGVA